MYSIPLCSSSSSVGPVANATDVLRPGRLILLALSPPRPVWTFPHSPPGASTSTTTWEILEAKGGTVWARIGPGNFARNCNFHVNSGIFNMPEICDAGPTALLPLRRRACWGFFRPEKSWRLRPGLNPRTSVLKGSTLPLDHQSRYSIVLLVLTNSTQMSPNMALICK